MTDTRKAFVDRFLAWRVPTTVCPDGVNGDPNRSGTNLLSAMEAAQLYDEIVSPLLMLPPPPATPSEGAGDAVERMKCALLEADRRWLASNANLNMSMSEHIDAHWHFLARAALSAMPTGAGIPVVDDAQGEVGRRPDCHPDAEVEAVARALCIACGYDPDEMSYTTIKGLPEPDGPYWTHSKDEARAAIDAHNAFLRPSAGAGEIEALPLGAVADWIEALPNDMFDADDEKRRGEMIRRIEQAARVLAALSAIAPGVQTEAPKEKPMTEDQIKYMASSFPDGGISFEPFGSKGTPPTSDKPSGDGQ